MDSFETEFQKAQNAFNSAERKWRLESRNLPLPESKELSTILKDIKNQFEKANKKLLETKLKENYSNQQNTLSISPEKHNLNKSKLVHKVSITSSEIPVFSKIERFEVKIDTIEDNQIEKVYISEPTETGSFKKESAQSKFFSLQETAQNTKNFLKDLSKNSSTSRQETSMLETLEAYEEAYKKLSELEKKLPGHNLNSQDFAKFHKQIFILRNKIDKFPDLDDLKDKISEIESLDRKLNEKNERKENEDDDLLNDLLSKLESIIADCDNKSEKISESDSES